MRLLNTVTILLVAIIATSFGNTSPHPIEGIYSDGFLQQPDPTKITTTPYCSRDNETIGLLARFPEDAADVKVSLYNILGRLIDTYPPQHFEKNSYIKFPFVTLGLPSGPYIIVLEANGQRITNKVVLSR